MTNEALAPFVTLAILALLAGWAHCWRLSSRHGGLRMGFFYLSHSVTGK